MEADKKVGALMGKVDVRIDDGLIEGFGEIVQSLYAFAKSINFHMFGFGFSLWDIFIAGCVIGLLALLWHGFTE